MSRTDLIKQLKRKNPNLNYSEIEIVVENFSNSVSNALKNGKNVEIRGFGRFICKQLKENWNLRNPSTNEIIYKPKRNRVRFKPSKNLIKLLNK